MQKILLYLLAFFAKKIISIHNPTIIGVTGTVGKTTLTSNITLFLREYFGEGSVEFSRYHYNGEYGLPLTIIGARTGGKNLVLWICIFLKAIYRMVFFHPRYIVLEYGIDHPGEMDFLLDIAIPDIAVISRISPNHLEQFGTFEAYFAEKMKITRYPDTVIIAHDSLRETLGGRARFFGLDDTSHARLIQVIQRIDGLTAEIGDDKEKLILQVKAFGSYQAENILPLLILSRILDIPADIIEKISPRILPEAGRSSILSGIGGSTIIDGSYNGGYESIREGLFGLMPFLTSHRIILFLGDMRELGDHAGELHTKVGSMIDDMFSTSDSDVHFFFVGPLMREYVYPLLHEKFKVTCSHSSRNQGKEIQKLLLSSIKPTLIYVKGSQNTIFLEEGIKEFLADPQEGKNLCRQSNEWIHKKEVFFKTVK